MAGSWLEEYPLETENLLAEQAEVAAEPKASLRPDSMFHCAATSSNNEHVRGRG